MQFHARGQLVEGIDEVMGLGHTSAQIDPCSADYLALHQLVNATKQLRVGDAVDVAKAKPCTKPQPQLCRRSTKNSLQPLK